MSAPTTSALLPIRTFLLDAPAPQVPVAIGRVGRAICLVHMGPTDRDTPEDWNPQVWAHLSVLSPLDPYPGYSGEGNEMIWVSATLENEVCGGMEG
jgi:hypothetical protein